LRDYSFDDVISGLPQTAIYYRLKMVNKDGTLTYSSVLLIRNSSGISSFNVYPNPVYQNAFLSYSTTTGGNITIDVIDASGKTVLTKKENIKKGETVIEIDGFSGLPSGSYLVRVRQNNNSSLSKWITKLK
jgi:hypothetical protein